jgi:hypothetical protein
MNDAPPLLTGDDVLGIARSAMVEIPPADVPALADALDERLRAVAGLSALGLDDVEPGVVFDASWHDRA